MKSLLTPLGMLTSVNTDGIYKVTEASVVLLTPMLTNETCAFAMRGTLMNWEKFGTIAPTTTSCGTLKRTLNSTSITKTFASGAE